MRQQAKTTPKLAVRCAARRGNATRSPQSPGLVQEHNMQTGIFSTATVIACLWLGPWCRAEEPLFEDTFDTGLSEKWKAQKVLRDKCQNRSTRTPMEQKEPSNQLEGSPENK